MATFRVVTAGERTSDTASGAMVRETAISGDMTGADQMWFGYAEIAPGMVSAVHHHGGSESGIYVISGRARFCVGDDLEDVHDASTGDFVFVPPHLVHVELNLSDDEPVRMAVTRTTQEAIVVNLDPPEGWQPPR